MRINCSEDEDFPGAIELWQANCDRSLKSKKGQVALRELEAALLALPEPRLIANTLDDGDDVCAIGALARHKGITPKADPEYEMEAVGMECGMPRLVAWKVVELNDIECDYRDMTPERRYGAVLKWTRKQLGILPTGQGE